MTPTLTRTRVLSGVLLVACAVAVGVPSAAMADTTSTVPRNAQAKADRLAYCHGHADAAIQARLTALGNDLTAVNSAAHLAPADKQTLLGLISSDQSGLTQLKATIDATTDPTTCHTDGLTIVTGYRVYVLVGPKVRLTIAADQIQAAGATLQSVATTLQNDINRAKGNGKDVAKAQEALNDLNTKTTAALSAAAPVPGQVLPLDPSGYPADATTLQSARQSLESARSDLHAARKDAAQVVADLQ